MDYADDAKLALIGWLLPVLQQGQVIGSELAFLDGRNRADIVVSSHHRLSAFEIKGPRDDLRKLSAQSAAYLQMFLDVSLVAPMEHIRAARALMPVSVGLLAIDRGVVRPIRAPRIRKALRREEAASWLKRDELETMARRSGLRPPPHIDKEDLRRLVLGEVAAGEIAVAAMKSAYDRLQPRFDAFKSELGQEVTLDDLRMLQLPKFVN